MIDLDMLVCDYIAQDGVTKKGLYNIYKTLVKKPVEISWFYQKLPGFAGRKIKDLSDL